MMSRTFVVLLLPLAVLVSEARAQQDAREEPSARIESPRSELPESVLRAERETGGQVLRAESMQRDGREVYRLKVLTPDGRVRIMRDDPRERRREAWREAQRGEYGPSPSRREPPPPPADLAMPETLPPIERGDRY